VTGSWRQSPTAALSILTGLNVLNYVDRWVVAATLPLILKEFAISDAEGGALQSAFILTYALASPPAGWLGDRRSRIHLAGLGVLVWSAATVASGLAPTYALLLCARALTGVGEASYAVVTPSLLSDQYPAERRATVLSVFYAAMPIGTALGYIAGGVIGAHYGWRPAFFVAGAPGAVLALLLLTLREPPRGQLDPSGASTVPLALGPCLRALASRRSYLFNTVAQTLTSFALGGLATWMPTYFVRERGLPIETAAATFGGLVIAAGFAGTLTGGPVTERLSKRWRGAAFAVSGLTLTASVASSFVAIFSPTPAVYWPAMFITLFLIFVNTGPLNAAMANVLPATLRARGFALYTLAIHLLGDAISPSLIGFASDRIGLALPVFITAALFGIAGLVLLATRDSLDLDERAEGHAPAASAPLHP
jgi:MFS family permease